MGDCNIYGGISSGKAGGNALWGGILGNIQSQTDLMNLLGEKIKKTIYKVEIGVNWDEMPIRSYFQTISVQGISEKDTPIVGLILDDNSETAQAQIEAWSCVSRIIAGENSIKIYCYKEAPKIPIDIQILCFSG